MRTFLRAAAIAVCGVLFSSAGLAQKTVRSDPLDPKARVAPVQYKSSFEGYKRFAEEPLASWKATNELVHKLGGWAAFARDKVPDVQPAPTEPAKKPASAPAAQGHKH